MAILLSMIIITMIIKIERFDYSASDSFSRLNSVHRSRVNGNKSFNVEKEENVQEFWRRQFEERNCPVDHVVHAMSRIAMKFILNMFRPF